MVRKMLDIRMGTERRTRWSKLERRRETSA